eukprot:PhM_4_TR13266/c0_g1_i1/m.48549
MNSFLGCEYRFYYKKKGATMCVFVFILFCIRRQINRQDAAALARLVLVHPQQAVRAVEELLLQRHHDELARRTMATQVLRQANDVPRIQRSVNLVQDDERRRLHRVQRKQKRKGRDRALAAAQGFDAHESLHRGRGVVLRAAVERLLDVVQRQVRGAVHTRGAGSLRQLLVRPADVLVDDIERLHELEDAALLGAVELLVAVAVVVADLVERAVDVAQLPLARGVLVCGLEVRREAVHLPFDLRDGLLKLTAELVQLAGIQTGLAAASRHLTEVDSDDGAAATGTRGPRLHGGVLNVEGLGRVLPLRNLDHGVLLVAAGIIGSTAALRATTPHARTLLGTLAGLLAPHDGHLHGLKRAALEDVLALLSELLRGHRRRRNDLAGLGDRVVFFGAALCDRADLRLHAVELGLDLLEFLRRRLGGLLRRTDDALLRAQFLRGPHKLVARAL